LSAAAAAACCAVQLAAAAPWSCTIWWHESCLDHKHLPPLLIIDQAPPDMR
jgi:hypothetical protein